MHEDEMNELHSMHVQQKKYAQQLEMGLMGSVAANGVLLLF
jgi:hypothetical protein